MRPLPPTSPDLAALPSTLKILLVEDVAVDAELSLRELKRAGLRCEGRRVETEVDFRQELEDFRPDVILSDFSMPRFDGMHALAIAARDYSSIPFIFVSGNLGEEYAVRALKNGATDYVLKSNLIRLPAAVERAISETLQRNARRQAEGELRKSEAGLSRAQSLAKLAHIITGLDGAFETWSDTLPQLLGIQPDQVPKSTRAWLALLHPDDRDFFRGKSIEAAITGARVDVEYRLRHANGDWIHVQQVIEPLQVQTHANATKQWFCTLQDVTERKRSEQKIKRLNRVYAVLSGINSAIVRIRDRQELFQETCRIIVEHGEFSVGWMGMLDHASGHLVQVAQAGLPDDSRESDFSGPGGVIPLGASEEALRKKRPAFDNDIERDPALVGVDLEPTAKNVRRAAIRMGARAVVSLPLFVAGETFGILSLYASEQNFFDDEEIKLLTALAGDISYALEYIEKEEKLNYLAYYDALTGLPNGTLFRDRLSQFIHAARGTASVATIILNLDRFRHLNDTLGRQAGDTALKIVADRLRQSLHEPVSLARISGDTFAIAIGNVAQEAVTGILEDRIFAVLEQPFELNGREIRVSTKAGIAVHPADGIDAESLFKNAEAALKQAKSSTERHLYYAAEMHARVAEKLSLETKLRIAIERREFVLHYQPKINMADGRICGLEALIRWNHPESGLVPPMEFIPLLEETALIFHVGAWALGQAVSDYRTMSAKGIACPRIAVNVSPLQLRQKDFANSVANAIGWAAGRIHGLDLEITESVIMENIKENTAQIRAVRDMGVNVAVDDFGTGYSSLAYISKLPVNTLKIDRSFVLAMEHSADDLNIVSTIITLAHSLKLNVIAEGVETEAQRRLLHGLKCDEMQGFLFSPPAPIEKIEAMLRGLSAKA